MISEMKPKEDVTLREALHLFLYDIMDVGDLQPNSSDDLFVDTLIEKLTDDNITCPYKNYGAETECPNKENCNSESLKEFNNKIVINCTTEEDDIVLIWKRFMKG